MYFSDGELSHPTEPELDPIKLGDPELSDVVLVVEQQEFHVHKMFLACRSDYFKAMFSGNFKEAQAKRVPFKDVTVDGFRRLLELLYSGIISDIDKFLPPKKIRTEMRLFNGDTVHHEHVGHIWSSAGQRHQHIVGFWTCFGELLATADRFNLKKLVLDHLQQAISTDICCRAVCPICLNYWIFAEEHGIDVQQKDRSLNEQTLKCWFDAIHTAPSCRGPIDFKLMEKLFEKTRKR